MRNSFLFPEDVLILILTRLPIKYILRLRSVCKYWNFVLQTTNFSYFHNNYKLSKQVRLANNGVSSFIILQYFKHKSHDHRDDKPGQVLLSFITVKKLNNKLSAKIDKVEKFDIPFWIKSMNAIYGYIRFSNVYGGIICLENLTGVILYNPYTKESHMLPFHPLRCLSSCRTCYDITSSNPTRLPECCHTTLGVWFEPNQSRTIKHYKVFSIFNIFNHSKDLLTHTYTYVIEKYDSIDGGWKQIKTIPKQNKSFTDAASLLNGLLLNEIFHLYIDGDSIITLDAISEKLGLLSLPSNWPYYRYNFFVLGGSLAILAGNTYGSVCTDVWLMTEYGVKKSWKKQYTILNEYITQPDPHYNNPYHFLWRLLANWKCMHEDEMILDIKNEADVYADYIDGSKKLVSFNPLSNKLTKIDIDACLPEGDDWLTIIPCIETLVFLK